MSPDQAQLQTSSLLLLSMTGIVYTLLIWESGTAMHLPHRNDQPKDLQSYD